MAYLFRLLCFVLCPVLLAAPALAQDYTGWWWNPDEPGTGYSLQVQDIPGKDYDLAYLVWYLYGDTGMNTWYSSIMQAYGGNMAGPLVEYEGWPVDAGVDAGVVSPTAVKQTIGMVTMKFSDADTGTLFYTVNATPMQRPIERWAPNGAEDPRNLLGWWWDEDKPGIGWFMEAKNDKFFLGWFNYRGISARTGARWYIALDENFSSAKTLFSQPFLEYQNGQTIAGEYKEPSFAVENPEENIEFTISADSSPEFIDLTYEANSFHLTRFQIPDIYTNGSCAPEIVSVNPPDGSSVPLLRPTLQAKVKTPCGSVIDNSSIVMKVNGDIVPHTVTNTTPDVADIKYKPTQWLAVFTTHYISVTVSDVTGASTALEWSFTSIEDQD